MTTRVVLSSTQREQLIALAPEADATPNWPAHSWDVLRQSGALSWVIPKEYGGDGWSAGELLEGYEQLASACLTTCFLLSQREAACRRLLDSGQERLCHSLLPALASGECFTTVGLSQLTTSRQHTGPALRVRAASNGFILDGIIPWVTGACKADYLIIGATLDDGLQILSVLPSNLPGVSIGPPLELAALQGSMTAEVRCEAVQLDRQWLLAGPSERVMQSGRGGTGGLETSCLALGLTSAAIGHLESEAVTRPDLLPTEQSLRRQYLELRLEMHRLAATGPVGEQTVLLRARANTLVLSATQAALTASKGVGFLRQHPAQRWARQALFFLVWSCPWPAAAATLAQLTAISQPPACS